MPSSIEQALIAIWVTIAIDVLLALYEKVSGLISSGEFVFALVLYSAISIIPYKIMNKSNAARYAYLILTIATFLSYIGGVGYATHKIDFVASILMMPLELFIIYRLYQKEASTWFIENAS